MKETSSSIDRNIILYSIYALFKEPLFWGPILITSLQKLAHMDLSSIYYMESAVIVICVLLDAPAGALADIIGRKKTLIIGQTFLLASTIGFATMTSPISAWVANILWAIGFSFANECDSSLVYESLEANGGKGSFRRLEGKFQGRQLLLSAFTSLAVGGLSTINLRLPLIICIPFVSIAYVTVFLFKETGVVKQYSMKEQMTTLWEGFKFARKTPEVCWIIGFAALLGGASKIWFFTYNPYFELVGIKLSHYGFIFFLLNIVACLFSHYADAIEKRLKERVCIVMMVLSIGLPILVMSLFPFWPFAYCVIFQNIVRGFTRPFVKDFMNRHLRVGIRSTVQSIRSTASNMVSIFTLSLFGWILKWQGVLSSMTILGVLVLVLGGLSYRKYRRLFK